MVGGTGGAVVGAFSPFSYKILPTNIAMNLVKAGYNKLPIRLRFYLQPENFSKVLTQEGRASIDKSIQDAQEKAAYSEVSKLLQILTSDIEAGAKSTENTTNSQTVFRGQST